MQNTESPKSLSSRVLKTDLVKWRDLKFVQQSDFKSWDPQDKEKLKKSIIENQFIQPFYVWEDTDENAIYCLDGEHRTLAMYELIEQGYRPSELLPATFIHCVDKQEAAKLVLIYSSLYAKITEKGLFDFIQMYELSYDDLKLQVDIPDFSMDRFEQKYDLYGTMDTSSDEDPDFGTCEMDIIVSPGDIFKLGNHVIACDTFKNSVSVGMMMNGEKARIIFCDPPYNLPANFFTNKEKDRHKDFAEAAGEMSDQEFSDFLAQIMQASCDHSVKGAIHYICMDFRHSWHMTDASRKVYGSVIPKQVCVWNKDLMANGSFYRAKHELVFIFQNGNAKHLWNKDLVDLGGFYKNENELIFIFKNGDDAKHLSHLDLADRIRTNVWNYPSATSTANPDRYELKNHPTPKPVIMVADAILDTTNEGDIVIDWFLGSGTTMIACEKTRRHCRATEIEPIYVQQSIIRYINYCDKNGIQVKFSHVNGSLTLNSFKNAIRKQQL